MIKQFILTTSLALTLAACYEVGPPNYNERDRRAYNSLEETRHDNYYVDGYYYPRNEGYVDQYGHFRYYVRDDGYYDKYGVFHYNPGYSAPAPAVVVVKHDKNDRDVNDDGVDDYNPHNGHDHWARQSN